MKKLREPSEKLHKALYFLSGVMTVVLVIVLVAGVKTMAQNNSRQSYEEAANPNPLSNQSLPEQNNKVGTEQIQEEDTSVTEEDAQELAETENKETESVEKWQEGIVTYKGKKYEYNNNIRTYLMMGVDNDDPVAPAEDYTRGGQSDAMFLVVTDTKKQTLKVISINRNTMTDIQLCDQKGNDLGEFYTQICLQHAFGDGKRLSCTRSVDAVSALFGNIPISGYLAMNMGGIPQMNDEIGGVELKVMQDVDFPKQKVSLKKGDIVTLNGTEAYYYLRGRDIEEFDSATDRLRREEQYILAYMKKLKNMTKGNSSKAVGIYNSISDYLVSSVDFSDLITELMGYEFSDDDMCTVPGETKMGKPVDGKRFEEYYVDEDKMQELIIQTFYEEY